MIGCIIVGGIAALMVARIAHRRFHGGWGCGGRWHRGGWHRTAGPDFGPAGGLDEDESAWMDGHGHGHGDTGWYGHHDHGSRSFAGWGGRVNPLLFGQGRGFLLRGILRRLETTPTQEKALRDAAKEFREGAKALKGEARRSRVDVAATLRRSSVDEVALGELFARHDGALDSVRKAFVGLTIRVHEILDDTQRERLAQLIELGPRWFRSPMTAAW